MNSQEKIATSDEFAAVQDDLVTAWHSIFTLVKKVVEADREFGFSLIEKNINPNLADISLSLRVMLAILGEVGSRASQCADYSSERIIINAQQHVLNFEMAVNALKQGNKEDYEAAISKMRSQTHI